MAVGCTLGVIFLLNLKSDVLLLLMGLFISTYAISQLVGQNPSDAIVRRLGRADGHGGIDLRGIVWQWRLFICDLFEQSPAQRGSPGDPECADQLQHGGAF